MRIISECNKHFDSIVISDYDLFKEPPPKEECPIYFLPMPHASGGACSVSKTYQPCCGNTLCSGCVNASTDEMKKGNIKRCCPFCRMPLPTPEEQLQRYKKRMEVGDADAFLLLGQDYKNGQGLPLNRKKALESYYQAAKLGSVEANHSIAVAYFNGDGIAKDIEKAINHFKIAAIGGHEKARWHLGILKQDND